MVTLAVVVTLLIVTVAVYEAEAVIAVGVPLISHVVELRLKPAGSDGDTVQFEIDPPAVVAVSVVITVSLVAVILDAL